MFSHELNDINNVKHDKQKCNRIIDEGGMELVPLYLRLRLQYIAGTYSYDRRGKAKT